MADLSVLYGYVTNRKRVPGMLRAFCVSLEAGTKCPQTHLPWILRPENFLYG
jgi:hypothetical protein